MSEGVPKMEHDSMTHYMEEATGNLCEALIDLGTFADPDYDEENYEVILTIMTGEIKPADFEQLILKLPKNNVTYEFREKNKQIIIRPIKH